MVTLYDDQYYRYQGDGSYRSAKIYIPYLLNIFKPKSVIDIGCGMGTWLKVFLEHGIEDVTGFDGVWNNQSNMIDNKIKFKSINLNEPICIQEKFDLAMSLEVAEHLEKKSAQTFVESLTKLSDIILFSAAYIHQGGCGHINEQKHSYWAEMFIKLGYFPYDLFRPVFWGRDEVEFWYRQNTFLYVKNDSYFNNTLNELKVYPIQDINFMDCVHPCLYNSCIAYMEHSFISYI